MGSVARHDGSNQLLQHLIDTLTDPPAMTSPSQPADDQKQDPSPNKRHVRTHTPRPDELSSDTLQFITAVDQYKREKMRSFLDDTEVIEIILGLGYRLIAEVEEVTQEQLDAYAEARKRYRDEEGRLFPTWSEVFKILSELGYERQQAA